MDEDLKRRFAELRAHDRQGTPSFDAMLAARPTNRYVPLRLAAAIAVLVTVGAVTAVLVHGRATRFQPVMLASWQSPTAFLLQAPGADLLGTVPRVTASVIHIEKGDTI
jgi:hypothetical protein